MIILFVFKDGKIQVREAKLRSPAKTLTGLHFKHYEKLENHCYSHLICISNRTVARWSDSAGSLLWTVGLTFQNTTISTIQIDEKLLAEFNLAKNRCKGVGHMSYMC